MSNSIPPSPGEVRRSRILKGLYRETPLLREHQHILDICQRINKKIPTMDDRKTISAIELRDIKDEYPDAFPQVVRFFLRWNFLRRLEPKVENHPEAETPSQTSKVSDNSGISVAKGGSQKYVINSRLDYDWAINLFSNRVDLLATGIYKFDDVLKGGLRVFRDDDATCELGVKQLRGFRLLVQGRPGSGKTTMALQMLSNFAAQGYSTVYLTAEQDRESLLRTLDRFSTVTIDKPASSSTESAALPTETPNYTGELFPRFAVRELHQEVANDRSRECMYWIDPSKRTPNEIDKTGAEREEWKKDAANFECKEPPFIEGFQYHGPGKRFWVALPVWNQVDKVLEFEQGVAKKIVEQIAEGNHGIIFVTFAPPNPIEIDLPQAQLANDAPKQSASKNDFENAFLPQTAAKLSELLRDLCAQPYKLTQPERCTSDDPDDWPAVPFSWMAIDSITAFEHLTTRREGLNLHRHHENVAILLLSEKVSQSNQPPTPEETSSDMTIELGERPLQITDVAESASNYMQRYVEVKKFRNAPFHRGKHPIAIKSHSLRVYRSIAILLKVTGNRRRSDELDDKSDAQKFVHFGIKGLDDALQNSIRPGSVTVLTGPPGSNKTALSAYFLTAEFAEKDVQKNCSKKVDPRSVIYSFSRDRRAVLNGMRHFVREDGSRLFDPMQIDSDSKLLIKDIKPGYLFPENFVEDLIDTLDLAQNSDRPYRRVVFDSFDNVHAAFPIMRMDQFLWKVIFQVCWDYGVSALLKIAALDTASSYHNNMATLVTGMADNTIRLDDNNNLRIVSTELGAHDRGRFRLHTERFSAGRPTAETVARKVETLFERAAIENLTIENGEPRLRTLFDELVQCLKEQESPFAIKMKEELKEELTKTIASSINPGRDTSDSKLGFCLRVSKAEVRSARRL